MADKTELKPCPDCGGIAIWQTQDDYGFIVCEKCGKRTLTYDGAKYAAIAWNDAVFDEG